MKTQSFDISANLLQEQFPTLFVKFVFVIILLFAFVMLVDLFKAIFGKAEQTASRNYKEMLLIVLNKIFLFGGIGFMLGNIVQKTFEQSGMNKNAPQFNISGAWNDLTFGIILLFIGFGLKKVRKIFLENSQINPTGPEEQQP